MHVSYRSWDIDFACWHIYTACEDEQTTRIGIYIGCKKKEYRF